MKPYKTYIKSMCQAGTVAAAALMLLLSTGCERRELYVYQDNFKQVEVNIDWRNYFREWGIQGRVEGNNNAPYVVAPANDPDGMTIWFFPRDGRTSVHYTTAEVRKFETYLSKGEYDAMVFDYSPNEYGRQEFVGMDYAETAKVQSKPASYQCDSIPALYGPEAYGYPLKMHDNGYCVVSNEPEDIASDTAYMNINTGKYDKYIPYKERNTYQSTLEKQVYDMEPIIDPWAMRIRIYIRNIHFLWQASATVCGLADGYYLVKCKSSETPCMLQLSDWEIHYPDQVYDPFGTTGYIAKTFKTWGPTNFENRNWDIHAPQRPAGTTVEYEGKIPLLNYATERLSSRMPNELRINLKCLLRDRKTVVYYHFNVGDLIHVFRNEYALRVDLPDGFEGQPELPYVDAYNGIDMGGIVVPWDDGGQSDVSM